jgi:hypothetical protein
MARKCSRLVCLSFSKMIMGSLVIFNSAGLYPVFEMLLVKNKNRMLGY